MRLRLGSFQTGPRTPSSSLEPGLCSGACGVGAADSTSCRRGCVQHLPVLTQTCAPTPVRGGVLSSLLGPRPLCDWPASPPLQEVQKGLQDRGQERSKRPFFLNVVQAVSQDGACVHAVADPRKGGEPSGY